MQEQRRGLTVQPNYSRYLTVSSPTAWYTNKIIFRVFFHQIQWISVDQLPKYINTSQLTTDLGGSLCYNHSEWVELKGIIDEFVEQAREMLDGLDKLKRSLLTADLANDLNTADTMLREHQKLKSRLTTIPIEVMEDRGRVILSRLNARSDSYDSGCLPLSGGSPSVAQNPDFQPLLNHVRQQLDRLHNVRGQLHQACQHRQDRLEHCRQLRAFEQQAEKVRHQDSPKLHESGVLLLPLFSDVGVDNHESSEVPGDVY